MWPVVHTQPNIGYLMGILSCYYNNWGLIYYNLVKQIFKYLSRAFDLEIIFTVNLEDHLVGYTYFNYARFIEGQKTTSSYIFILFGKLLSYQLKLQSIVALLSTKAKYKAITEAKKKVF